MREKVYAKAEREKRRKGEKEKRESALWQKLQNDISFRAKKSIFSRDFDMVKITEDKHEKISVRLYVITENDCFKIFRTRNQLRQIDRDSDC